MKNILYIATVVLLSSVQTIFAQVGIGTTTPTETLQVAGNAKLSGELTLEDPGTFTTNTDNNQRYLIVNNTSGSVNRYLTGNGATKAKYSPVNYATYELQNLSTAGLTDFDTKISATKYIVSVQSYEFSDTSTIFDSTTGTDSVNGIVYRAFRAGGTWHLSFYGVDSVLINSNQTLTLDVVIYRNKLLMADDNSTIMVNMGNTTTATAMAPSGY